MEKIEQTDKSKHTQKKTAKIIWKSIYPLKELILKEDFAWVNRERGKYELGSNSHCWQEESISGNRKGDEKK
jgi:hypothetical protein